MADFHRLTTPGYYTGGGTFPVEAGVTFDYINNAGSGTPANADGAKVGGPNAGTYFTAFAEDATSNNANRGLKALAQNTDYLDDLFHRSIAVAVRTNDAVAGGGGVTSVVLPVGTYLGPSGTTNTAAGLAPLFSIVDENDNDIVNGSHVVVNTVTLGGGDALGANGFSANTVTLNISPAIPPGLTYRIYYGTRTNLATMPVDAFTNIRIKGAQEIDADIELVLSALHGAGAGWDAAWTSTIYDLTYRGLQGVYDFDTVADLSPAAELSGTTPFFLNTPQNGMGGWFERLGPAMTGYANQTTAYKDPINALWASKFTNTTLYSSGGSVGFAAYGTNRYLYWDGSSSFDDQETANPEYATFLSLRAHSQTGTTVTTNGVNGLRTRVPLGTTCSLTTPGSNPDTGEAVIELTAANTWFRGSTGLSAVMLGYDMFEVQYTQGGLVKREAFVAVGHGSGADPTNVAKIRVRRPDGKIPDFTGASVSTIVGWHSLGFGMGDGGPRRHSRRYGYSENVKLAGLTYIAPPLIHAPSGSSGIQEAIPALFVARGLSTGEYALQWGGMEYDTTVSPHGVVPKGYLQGDGAVGAPYTIIDVVEGGRYQPMSVDNRTINSGGGPEVEIILDMNTYDTFLFTIQDNTDSTVLADFFFTFDTTPPTGQRAIRAGAKYTIYVKCGASQTGGIGAGTVGIWPASVKGLPDDLTWMNITTPGAYVVVEIMATTLNGTEFIYLNHKYGET